MARNCYAEMDIKRMVQSLEKEAQGCAKKMNFESERCERACERIFYAFEFLNNTSCKENDLSCKTKR